MEALLVLCAVGAWLCVAQAERPRPDARATQTAKPPKPEQCEAYRGLAAVGITEDSVTRTTLVMAYKQWTSRLLITARPVCSALVKGIRLTSAGRGALTNPQAWLEITGGPMAKRPTVRIPMELEGMWGLRKIGSDAAQPSEYLSAVFGLVLAKSSNGTPVSQDFTELDIDNVRTASQGGHLLAIDWYRRQLEPLRRGRLGTLGDVSRFHNYSCGLVDELVITCDYNDASRVLQDYWQRLQHDDRRGPKGTTVSQRARSCYDALRRKIAKARRDKVPLPADP
jgi:hypothetical protein